MLTLNFTPFPEITTERLLLRQLTPGDVDIVFLFRSDKDIMKYIERDPVKTIDEAHAFIDLVNGNIEKNDSIAWVITMKDKPEQMIGIVSLWRIVKEHYRAEMGYILHPDYQGCGIMHEAVGAVIDYGFNTAKLHSIEANTNPLNKASQNVLLKHGFTQEAYFTENYYYNGKFFDSAIFSLVNRH